MQSSLKDSFEKGLKEVGNLRTNIQYHDTTPSRFSHTRTVVIHNMPDNYRKTVTNFSTFLVNDQISLSNIEVHL